MTEQYLHWTFGPVQGFVAQARRTRDLWAGSFLLSYLAGKAMEAVQQRGAEVTLPEVVGDPLLLWIKGRRQGEAPVIGSLPNRFKAKLSPTEADAATVGSDAAAAVQTAWEKIAQAVWDKHIVSLHLKGDDAARVQDIWTRQVTQFWDIQWVVAPERSSALDQRKNWRSHQPPVERGDKCVMMPDYQELSGLVRAHDSKRQDKFWEDVRARAGLNLRQGERLCATALIKRFFPGVSKAAIGWDVQLNNWPSTSYIAAIPWIKEVVEDVEAAPLAAQYAENIAAAAAEDVNGEWTSPKRIPSLHNLDRGQHRAFLRLDGPLFFKSALSEQRRVPLKEEPARKGLLDQLGKIKDKLKKAPSPFYGLLLMDGDSLGEMLSTFGGTNVSKALAKFTAHVPDLVSSHDGVLIYAGGDDVLAMLPAVTAISCASAIEKAYCAAFYDTISDPSQRELVSISASILLAHYQNPLRSIVQRAHRLLDDEAKDTNGRASLAVEVWKPSGLCMRWLSTWQNIYDNNPLLRLQGRFLEGQISGRFIYQLREKVGSLCQWNLWEAGTIGDVSSFGNTFDAFVLAEYLHTQEATTSAEDAKPIVRDLLSVMPRAYRNPDKTPTIDHNKITIDGVLLARFFANGAQEDT